MFADREYTLVAIPDDRASIEIVSNAFAARNGLPADRDESFIEYTVLVVQHHREVERQGFDGAGQGQPG